MYKISWKTIYWRYFHLINNQWNNRIMKKKQNKFENRYFRDSVSRHLINAGEEFLRTIKGHRVLCATIAFADYTACDTDRKDVNIELKIGYTKHQFQHVLNLLKHCWYDAEHAIQYLNSTVWCDKGIWFERNIGDASWKKYFSKKQNPAIPRELY